MCHFFHLDLFSVKCISGLIDTFCGFQGWILLGFIVSLLTLSYYPRLSVTVGTRSSSLPSSPRNVLSISIISRFPCCLSVFTLWSCSEKNLLINIIFFYDLFNKIATQKTQKISLWWKHLWCRLSRIQIWK